MIRVGRGRRPGDAALDLRVRDPVCQERERDRRIVSGLHFERGPVDGGAIQPRRRACLQAAHVQAQAFQGQRQAHGRRLADPACGDLAFTKVDQPPQERARGQDHGAAAQFAAVRRDHAVTRPSTTFRSSAPTAMTVRLAG
jgi:hypothetical protein